MQLTRVLQLLSLRKLFSAASLPELALKISRCEFGALPQCYSLPLHHFVLSCLQRDPSLRPTARDLMHVPLIVRDTRACDLR